MRKKPKCSVNAALRMQEIKKEQELEMLRFHIVKACLFKKKHNPQTAPIRIDELKELAKYWKLHRTRGFWRDHPEKEDLVRALTEHVKDKFGTADTETVTEMRFNDASQYVSHTSNAKAQMFENYTGDLFGTRGDYNNGMIYLSRMIKPDEESGRSEFADGLPALSGTEDNPNGMNAALFDEQRLQQEERRQVEAQNHREMRRKTAQSLYNLSCHAGTEIKILAEGGMGALLSLASFDDIETNRCHPVVPGRVSSG